MKTSDTFMDLPGFQKKIENSIKNSLKIDDKSQQIRKMTKEGP